MSTKVASLLLAAVFLSGCVSNYPRDIDLVSVQSVNDRDLAELEWRHFLVYLRKAQWERGDKVIYEDDIEKFSRILKRNKAWYEQKPNAIVLKFQLRSKENLHQYARDKGVSLRASLYFCNRHNQAGFLRHVGYIYWQGINLSMIGGTPAFSVQRSGNSQPLTYYTFAWASNETTNSMIAPYDLRKSAEDVCLRVEGSSSYSFFQYRSNVIVIPREKIAEALRSLPPPFDAGMPPDTVKSD